MSPSRAARPWSVVVLSLLVALEALGLAVGAVGFVVSLFSRHVLPWPGIVFAAVVLAAGALWLGAAARGAWRAARWPRAAILVTQAFLVVVGLSAAQSGAAVLGIPAVVLAVVTIVLLFQRPTVEWMSESRRFPVR